MGKAVAEVPGVGEVLSPHRGEGCLLGRVVEAQNGIAGCVEIDSFLVVILNFNVQTLTGNDLVDVGGVLLCNLDSKGHDVHSGLLSN